MANRLFALSSSLVILSGCYYFKPRLAEPEQPQSAERFFGQPAVEKAAIGESKWGLAISGGGIRSATIAVGALKALYDYQILERVDAISTVSGGGYVGYWLYSREYKEPSRPEHRFGAQTFEDSSFIHAACDVSTTGNFFNLGLAALKAVRTSPATQYSDAIRRTFGQATYSQAELYETGVFSPDDTLEFHKLADLVSRRVIPNLIVNSRVYRPKPQYGFADGIYELTPFVRGTATREYRAWSGDTSYPLLYGVGASGAAVAFPLDRTLPDEVSGNANPAVQLSDGGHGENLGALSLIRRRVPNIIIVDAEHDPGISVNSYQNLKRRLENWGDTLNVPALNDIIKNHADNLRPLTGAFVGTVHNANGYKATVYYMKLSVPMSLNPVLQDSVTDAKGEAERERMFQAIEKGTMLGPKKDKWDCSHLRNLNIDMRAVGVHEIGMFLDPKELNERTIPRSWKSFPHKSTFDLRYNLDRTMAQIALGYLLGEELAKEVRAAAP
jgi:hypothetical protein